MKDHHGSRMSGRLASLALMAALLVCASGCAVQAYQREKLATRIMTFEADAKEHARMVKSLEAREGSTGGTGGAGGGCACN
jgi:hypothetical protein